MKNITFLINALSWAIHQWWVWGGLAIAGMVLVLTVLRWVNIKEEQQFDELFKSARKKGINVWDGRRR